MAALRNALKGRLLDEVAGMTIDNFIVRPKRLYVEKYQQPEAWETLGAEDRAELCQHVAGLPSAFDDDELERIFRDKGIAADDDLERIKGEMGGLGLFIRSLVGLDREAAKLALNEFIEGRTANQIEFVDMIIDHLTERGTMEPSLLYEAPFTDFDEQGVNGVFSFDEAKKLAQALGDIRARAAA